MLNLSTNELFPQIWFAIVASRAVDPVGSPSSTTIDQDEQSTRPVPQFIAPGHSSLGPVLYEMTSDQIRSDLTPQRQEMSIEIVSSGLVPQGQKASDYDNFDPVPPRQNVVPTAEKTKQGSYKKLVSLPHATLIIPMILDSFQKQVMITDGPEIIILLEQVRGNPTMPRVSNKDDNLSQISKGMFVLTVSIVEPKNLRRHMVILHGVEAYAGWNFISSTELNVWETRRTKHLEVVIKLKWLWKNKKVERSDCIRNKARLLLKVSSEEVFDFEESFALVARLEAGQALYGLKQAPRAWYDELSNFLMSKGFSKAFSDADHAGCLDTRKSTSGGIQFLGDKLVSWMSKKQNCTAMSSAEAEYVALFASLCSKYVDEA
ncbi:hypothetical protein Tco_1501742 [Tanacetum coccineum]